MENVAELTDDPPLLEILIDKYQKQSSLQLKLISYLIDVHNKTVSAGGKSR